MHPERRSLSFFILPILLLLLAASAVAQQYQILRADYGYGDRRIDVTQRLRELARSDTTFRMGNSTFGTDPAPGYVKTLRIFTRATNGETRTFEYREGNVVDGAMFSGWGGGDWGWNDSDNGQYVILAARYGVPDANVDVSARLKELARQDRTFRMGNSTFGMDPAPGRVKTLRIYTQAPGGGNRIFEYREGSVVDGSMFRSWGGGEWGGGGWQGGWDYDEGQYTILQARYGVAGANVDVTQRLRELARQDTTFRMGNSTFGVDPAPGRVKTLRIFTRGPGGANRTFEYREGSVVNGSLFRGWGRADWGGNWEGGWGDGDRQDEGQYRILRALYGTSARNVDVTQRLRELARQDRTFRMGNSTFGVDPDPGRVKTLRIYTRGPGGAERMFEYREGSVVDGSQFTGWGGGDWGRETWNGRWGDDARDDRDNRWNDRPNQNYGQLTIIRATYGDGRRDRDVTDRLRSLIRNGRLTVTANNGTFGFDPAPGARKVLKVTYSTGRGQQQTQVTEGSQLNIP